MAPVILLHMRYRVSGLTGTESLRKEAFHPSFFNKFYQLLKRIPTVYGIWSKPFLNIL